MPGWAIALLGGGGSLAATAVAAWWFRRRALKAEGANAAVKKQAAADVAAAREAVKHAGLERDLARAERNTAEEGVKLLQGEMAKLHERAALAVSHAQAEIDDVREAYEALIALKKGDPDVAALLRDRATRRLQGGPGSGRAPTAPAAGVPHAPVRPAPVPPRGPGEK